MVHTLQSIEDSNPTSIPQDFITIWGKAICGKPRNGQYFTHVLFITRKVKSDLNKNLNSFVGQMFLMDRFFNGAFLTFGLEVIAFAERDQV